MGSKLYSIDRWLGRISPADYWGCCRGQGSAGDWYDCHNRRCKISHKFDTPILSRSLRKTPIDRPPFRETTFRSLKFVELILKRPYLKNSETSDSKVQFKTCDFASLNKWLNKYCVWLNKILLFDHDIIGLLYRDFWKDSIKRKEMIKLT